MPWSSPASPAWARPHCSPTPPGRPTGCGCCGRTGCTPRAGSRSPGCTPCCARRWTSCRRFPSPRPRPCRPRSAWPSPADRAGSSSPPGCWGCWPSWPRREPVLCLVDDAQWVDGSSMDALLFAARRIESDRLAILVATRPGELESPGLPELWLGPLGTDQADQLLADHAPLLDLPSRRRILELAAGNPLALVELGDEVAPTAYASRPGRPELTLSARLEATFLGRVRQLAPEAQRLLLVAAADDSGRPADPAGGGRCARHRPVGARGDRAGPAAAPDRRAGRVRAPAGGLRGLPGSSGHRAAAGARGAGRRPAARAGRPPRLAPGGRRRQPGRAARRRARAHRAGGPGAGRARGGGRRAGTGCRADARPARTGPPPARRRRGGLGGRPGAASHAAGGPGLPGRLDPLGAGPGRAAAGALRVQAGRRPRRLRDAACRRRPAGRRRAAASRVGAGRGARSGLPHRRPGHGGRPGSSRRRAADRRADPRPRARRRHDRAAQRRRGPGGAAAAQRLRAQPAQ